MTFKGVISTAIRKLDSTTQRLRALKTPPPAPASKPAAATPGEGTSGRVRHDERGNAVWDIAVSTGVFALESTSKLLKRLEAPELKIADERELELEDGQKGRGCDPYNRGR